MAIVHAVVYYAQAAQAFSAEIKCRHCRWLSIQIIAPACRMPVVIYVDQLR